MSRATLTLLLCISIIHRISSYNEPLPNPIISIANDDAFLEDIQRSIDSLFEVYLTNEESIQGGVLSMVSSDSILYIKGYGKADLEQDLSFHPSESKVMIASVAKLITVTAILQLLEKNKITLDQPLSELIGDLKLKNTFNTSVLLRHVLTHTAGFDDQSIGSEALKVEDLQTLEEFLRKRLPPIAWEPGQFFNYSNRGVVLLAYIVEKASGQSFDDYLKENLFNPLNMNDSGFAYSDELLEGLMRRYNWVEDQEGKLYFEDHYQTKFTNQIGASGFKTTAKDMSSFMQMYLKNGVFKGQQVLDSSIIQNAFSTHFEYHPLMDHKQGLIWRIMDFNNFNYIYHSGDDRGMESLLFLVPEVDLGVFFTSNNGTASALKRDIRDLILRKINTLRRANKTYPEYTTSNVDLKKLAGSYQYMNDGQKNVERITYLFGDVSTVRLDQGNFYINGSQYRPIDDLLFRRERDSLLGAFKMTENMLSYSTGYATYRKLKWYENPSLHVKSLLGSFLIMLTGLIAWPLQYRRKLKRKNSTTPLMGSKFFIGMSVFSLLLFFILLGVTTDGLVLKYGAPFYFKSYFIFPLLGLLFYAIGMVKVFGFLKNTDIKWTSKLHLGLVLTAVSICLLIYDYYNLIGFNF